LTEVSHDLPEWIAHAAFLRTPPLICFGKHGAWRGAEVAMRAGQTVDGIAA
jgi:hypothetical protein